MEEEKIWSEKYVLCECGKHIFKSNLAGHKKHKLHLKIMTEKKGSTKENLKNELDILKKYGLEIKE